VPSLLVFTGVSTPAEVIVAPPSQRPAHLGFDMRAVVDAGRSVDITSGGTGWQAGLADGALTLTRDTAADLAGTGPDADALHALAALAQVSWSAATPPAGAVTAVGDAATAVLDRLGLRAG
jgi:hypothetical protein